MGIIKKLINIEKIYSLIAQNQKTRKEVKLENNTSKSNCLFHGARILTLKSYIKYGYI